MDNLGDLTVDAARALTLDALWRKQLHALSDEDLAAEREYCGRELAYAMGEPLGDGTIPPECWNAIYAGRIAWLDSETGKRARIAGLYRKADTGFTCEYVEHVKRQVDLAELITARHPDVQLKRYGSGSGYLGFCPWHDDQHRSLGVWERPEHHWFCFACLTGGDVFSWLLKGEASGFRQAVTIAAKHAGILPPTARLQGVKVHSV